MTAALVYLLISIAVTMTGASMIDSMVGMSILAVYWGANALFLFVFMASGGPTPVRLSAKEKAEQAEMRKTQFNIVWDTRSAFYEFGYKRAASFLSSEIHRIEKNCDDPPTSLQKVFLHELTLLLKLVERDGADRSLREIFDGETKRLMHKYINLGGYVEGFRQEGDGYYGYRYYFPWGNNSGINQFRGIDRTSTI